MTTNWAPAHGEHQLPFMGAANRALHGELRVCPKCNGDLRAYFHVFHPDTGKGSLWVWCGTCGLYTTLPLVKPTVSFPDPLGDVPRGEFAALETNRDERFLDRLERMWNDGILRLRAPTAHMITSGAPDAIMQAHPELAAVGEALAQGRRGEPITARCIRCQQTLQITTVEATNALVVSCPDGHTNFRAGRG